MIEKQVYTRIHFESRFITVEIHQPTNCTHTHTHPLSKHSSLSHALVNKFGDQDSPDRARTTSDTGEDESPATSVTATTAVVSLKLSIEGDSTRLPYIRYRRDVRESLERIAADAQVEDCLLSAEILWAPENDDDRLTPDDIYTSYPDLVPL